MLIDFPGGAGLLVLIALVPGIVCWWRGRALARLTDDVVLPERLLAARRQNAAALSAAFVALMALSMGSAFWTLPLMALALVVGSYPLRRALFGETWSLASYVSFATRLLIGIWGFWIALLVTPSLLSYTGSLDWIAAIAMGTLLIVWNARYADVFRALVRTHPIADQRLVPRFTAMVQTSGIAMPRFESVDLHGGAIANAIALPSLRGSSVVFTQTLLDRLDVEEIVAICAHELAHLEHFNPRYLRRIDIINKLLIVSGAAVAPLSRFAGLSSSLVPDILWSAAFLVALIWRVHDRQRQETSSDLRAIALCGNSEALVRGLIRLYAMGRVPRRLDAELERHATHPSLARRIRDIRAAAGTTAAALGSAATFTGTDGRSAVTFENNTLHWREGEGAVHSLSYAYLSELRLQVRGARPATLIAIERQGRRWEMALAADDLARVQAVLDIIDAQLPAPSAPPSMLPKVNRLVLTIGAVVGVLLGQLAMAFVAILALLQPAAPLVAAAGIASLTVAGLVIQQGGFGAVVVGSSLLLAGFGVLLLIIARSQRDVEVPRHAAFVALLLGGCALWSVASLALGGMDPVRLHQSARSASGAPVLLLAFAGALSVWRLRRVQYAAIPIIVMAAATTVAASTSFLDRFGKDPFIAPTQSLAWEEVNGRALTEFRVPFVASALQLSPAGRHVAIASEAEDRRTHQPPTYHVGLVGGSLTPIVADDLLFVDDEHILILRSDEDAVEIREARLDSRQASAGGESPKATASAQRGGESEGAPPSEVKIVWSTRIPDITEADLSFMSATRRWRVIGWDRKEVLVRAEGVLGSPAVQRAQWNVAEADSALTESIATSGTDAILVQARYDVSLLQRYGLWRWPWMFPPDRETHFRLAGDAVNDIAVSRLTAQCFGGALDSDQLLCGAFDGTRTRFIGLDPASKRLMGLAWLDGRFTAFHTSPGEWLAGWRDGSPVVLNVHRRQAIGIPRDCRDRVFQLAASDRSVATIAFDGTGSTVKLYARE